MNNNRGFHLSVFECPQSDLLTIPSWTSSCKNDLVIFWQFIHSINIAENPAIQRWLEESYYSLSLPLWNKTPEQTISVTLWSDSVCVSELVCCIGGIKWCSIAIQTLNFLFGKIFLIRTFSIIPWHVCTKVNLILPVCEAAMFNDHGITCNNSKFNSRDAK